MINTCPTTPSNICKTFMFDDPKCGTSYMVKISFFEKVIKTRNPGDIDHELWVLWCKSHAERGSKDTCDQVDGVPNAHAFWWEFWYLQNFNWTFFGKYSFENNTKKSALRVPGRYLSGCTRSHRVSFMWKRIKRYVVWHVQTYDVWNFDFSNFLVKIDIFWKWPKNQELGWYYRI